MQHDDKLHDLAMKMSLAITGFTDAATQMSDQINLALRPLDFDGLANVSARASEKISLTIGAVDFDGLSLPEDGDLPPVERVQALKARRNTVAAQRDRKRRQRAARFER